MSKRVINTLRKLFPDQSWKYDPQGFRWIGSNFEVFGESSNYDDTSGYHTVSYRRSDTYELIEELGFKREFCG